MPTVDDATVQVAANGRFEEKSGLWDDLSGAGASPSIPHRYQVLSEIGRGGMGIVYKVRDIDTHEIVALKILKPEIAGDPAMRESLRKEVCLARKVTHKNVCRIHEFSRFESSACISMELVDGESLLSKLQRKGVLPASETVDIGRQICAGLSEAHAQGIVHRDLKPANIVVADNQVVKIMDFGIARQTQDATQMTMMLAGTPAYMAPEQVESKAVTPRTDIYALGLLLYEMATGQPAFSGESVVILALKQIREEPTRPTKIAPAIPARLDTAILKCLEKNPEDRFSSVDELSLALANAFAPTTAEKFSETVLEPTRAAICKGARATASGLDRLAIEIAKAAREAEKTLRPMVVAWLAETRAQRWFVRPIRTAQFAMLFGIAMVSTSIVFAILTRSQPAHAAEDRKAAAQIAGADQSAAANGTAFEPAATFEEKEFDFDSTDSASAGAEANHTPTAAASAAMAVPKPAAISSKVTAMKPVTPVQRRALATTANNSNQHTLAVAAAAPAPANMLSPSDPQAAFADALRNSPLPISSAAGATTLLPLLTPAPAIADQGSNSETKPALSENYLEVGTFNDASWADDAVAKLSQMGFHAICVHKTHLWGQSYHVQVGPFQALKELEDAAQQLTAKGFKPHAVK